MTKRLLHIPTATYWVNDDPGDMKVVKDWVKKCGWSCIEIYTGRPIFFFHYDPSSFSVLISEDLHEFEVIDV